MNPPRILARYKKEYSGGRIIGEFQSLASLERRNNTYGTPNGFLEVGFWNGEAWEWADFGCAEIES